jgi:hypothetical protein
MSDGGSDGDSDSISDNVNVSNSNNSSDSNSVSNSISISNSINNSNKFDVGRPSIAVNIWSILSNQCASLRHFTYPAREQARCPRPFRHHVRAPQFLRCR